MAGHSIECFAPGVGMEAEERLAEALSRAGRDVTARQRLDPARPLPPLESGMFRWRLLPANVKGGTVLVVQDALPERWDLDFFRALSAVTEGVVVGMEQYDLLTRRGLATFFSGRTLEVALEDGGLTSTTLGSPPLYQALGGSTLEGVYEERFGDLCNTLPYRLRLGEVLAAGDWTVTPPTSDFVPEVLPTESLLVLANVEEPAWRAAAPHLAPGGRWRAGRGPTLNAPFIELRHPGPFDEARVTAISDELACPVSALELVSAGAPFRWAEANQGALENTGRAEAGAEFLKALFRSVFFMGEGPGLLFGRGPGGWNEISQ
ncbi:hypothetical protein JY651_48000 [Pyxidicoccus parkwayensis]|uniref:Uncharacterized protein n=1 Tax=Pyxidicoccus parkwayensis TaxID=2813578 RepID=A0ABX7NZC1_9BACT|nr:hypothetical protein [Pyxidicoccus parkwaysis]QSQ22759.1 hypothetical protein JY651_48000 [Pyxidicoccus parkwaysis]